MLRIMDFLTSGNHIYHAEILTVIAILVVLGYFFYVFNVFKKG